MSEGSESSESSASSEIRESRESRETGEAEGPREADRVRAGRIAATGFIGLVVFGVGALWAASVQIGLAGSIHSGRGPKPEKAGDPEVGIVFQRPFDERDPADASAPEGIAAIRAESARERLRTTGWVDRDAGLAHIPIDQAMNLVVQDGSL